jgi:integrase
MDSGGIKIGLRWGDVDLTNGLLSVKDTKGGENRAAYLTEATRRTISERTPGGPGDLVFPAKHGGRRVQVSKAFDAVVKSIGLNDRVSDQRERICFHSLRHTFASWLVCSGTPLYTVQRLLGYKSIALTERYSHLAPDHVREAVKLFDKPQDRKAEVFPLMRDAE